MRKNTRIFLDSNIVIELIPDSWDDWFSYETTYQVEIIIQPSKKKIRPGKVKIGEKDLQPSTNFSEGFRSPSLQDRYENTLSSDTFSVGFDENYYSELSKLNADVAKKILIALNDIVFNTDIYENNKDEGSMLVSLMREYSGVSLQDLQKNLFKEKDKPKREPGNITAKINFNKSGALFNYKFMPNLGIPTNLWLVTGENSSGKSTIIDSITTGISEFNISINFTNFTPTKIIRISNSKFSTSIWNEYLKTNETDSVQSNAAKLFNVGIGKNEYLTGAGRMFSTKFNNILSRTSRGTYRSSEEKEFGFYMAYVMERPEKINLSLKLIDLFPDEEKYKVASIIENLGNFYTFYKQNFDSSALQEMKESVVEAGLEEFNQAGSGIKYLLICLLALSAIADEATFVLIDEPENHLHVRLLNAFCKMLYILGNLYKCPFLISTHSSMIARGAIDENIAILSRKTGVTTVRKPEIRTYGQSVALIEKDLFGVELGELSYLFPFEYHQDANFEGVSNYLGDEALYWLAVQESIRND